MAFDTIGPITTSATVNNGGTISVAYPTGRTSGSYDGSLDHKFIVNNAVFSSKKGEISLTFGSSDITLTYNGSTPIDSGTNYRVELDRFGDDDDVPEKLANADRMSFLYPVNVNFGTPLGADGDGILNDATATDSAQVITTFLKSKLDVPRQILFTGTAGSNHVITVTGKDEYGKVMKENLTLNGTNIIGGNKAFSEITQVDVAAGAADDTFDMGWGDKLGIPVFIPLSGLVFKELEDGVAVGTAGTVTAGITTTSTATTSDVRGLYDPNSALNGSKSFQVVFMVENPANKGNDQFSD